MILAEMSPAKVRGGDTKVYVRVVERHLSLIQAYRCQSGPVT